VWQHKTGGSLTHKKASLKTGEGKTLQLILSEERLKVLEHILCNAAYDCSKTIKFADKYGAYHSGALMNESSGVTAVHFATVINC
jgi:hypothetical protein